MLSKPTREREISFAYLRATLTLMVVAYHASMSYTTWATFDAANYLAFTPIADSRRSVVLNFLFSFNDTFFMSLMFFISGLFVWPSLHRHGVAIFVRRRLIRLGLPFVLGVVAIIPLANYAAWLMTGAKTGYLVYWRGYLQSQNLSPGPLWFLWLLMLFDIVVASVFLAWPSRGRSSGSSARTWVNDYPVRAAIVMFFICAFAYLPTAAIFGTSLWAPLLTPPFYFQVSRVLLYFVWFGMGVWVGNHGLGNGVFAPSCPLAQSWAGWLCGCLSAYGILIIAPSLLDHARLVSGVGQKGVAAVLWLISCVASSFAFLAFFLRFVVSPTKWMNSLARCSYGIYLVHYIFVLWIQRLLTTVDLQAIAKFAVVFSAATLLSWATAYVLLRVPGLNRVL